MTDIEIDPISGLYVANTTNISTDQIMSAAHDPVMAALSQWVNATQSFGSSNSVNGHFQNGRSSLFERDRYVSSHSVFDHIRLAAEAVETDDVVSGVRDTTEALCFSEVGMYAEDQDEEDVYNQVAADINLDALLREMWSELFTASQFYAAVWWADKVYKVRGESDKGVARKKTFRVRVPESVTLLDPLKVIPVGSTMFGQEQLAYVADPNEAELFDQVMAGDVQDDVVRRLILGRYNATRTDQQFLTNERINSSASLFLLNSAVVFRHTVTRPGYRRFAEVRLRSCFELLDMKRQLRAMDRAHLIGGANFIVLITKGTDQHPARPEEIANLQVQVRTVAKVPVLVGDHRLHVEIVTPKLDNTLDPKRYDLLDGRLTARLYGMFVTGGPTGSGTRSDDSGSLMKVIARGLESRRHMLRRTLEAEIFRPMFEQNDAFKTAPKLRFHPKNIALDFDSSFASFLLDLRAQNDISRETILSQFDLDQADEAQMLEREAQSYDAIFKTQIPFSSPNPRNTPSGTEQTPAAVPDPVAKRRAGRQGGGTRNGGGAAPGSGQGQAPTNPRRKAD